VPLTHKFAKQSRVGLFCKNAPDPVHLTKTRVLGRYGLFRYCTKVDAKLAEPVPLTNKFDKKKLRRNFSQRTHPIHSIGHKTHVLGRFGLFRYCTKVDGKLAELVPLMHKFTKQSRVGIVRNERIRTTLLDPKLMFWGVW
jgi:hypothetical protein